MSLDKLDTSLFHEIQGLKKQGRAKNAERVICEFIPPKGELGPRYRLQGSDTEFIRLNSNSYLSLSCAPQVIKAA